MKIIKLYSKYFFSLSNFIIIVMILFFLIGSYIFSIFNINESLSYNNVLQFYFENSTYYTKIILIIFSGFLFMKLCNERNEYILNIVITAGYNKKQNFKYMILSNILIVLVITILSLIFYIIIGYISKKYFVININYLITFINIFLLSLYYGLLSYFLSQVFRNQFLYILLIIMYFISELFVIEENATKYIYLFFFPNIENSSGDLYINIIYLILMIIVLYIINKTIYLNKDLKN